MSWRPTLPKRRDWLLLAALVVGGCALGLAANAVNPNGINVRIAFGFPAAEALP